MKKSVLTLLTVVSVISVACLSGCRNMRFAPTEKQKADSALHIETAATLADTLSARPAEDPNLILLAKLNLLQAANLQTYIGPPANAPDANLVASLKQLNQHAIASAAQISLDAAPDAAAKPEFWDYGTSGLELLLALLALAGTGAGVVKASGWVSFALTAIKGLKEVVEANEAVKAKYTDSAQLQMFKDIQSLVQSDSTVKLVDELRKQLAARDAEKKV